MRFVLFSLIFIFLPFLPLTAQKALTIQNKKTIRLYDEAKALFAKGELIHSQALLENALEREPRFMEAMLLLGDVFHTQKEYELERTILKRSLQVDSAFYISSYYNIGEAALRLGDFSEALSFLRAFRNKTTDAQSIVRADRLLERVVFTQKAMADPWPIELRNEGEGINSPYDEYWPSLTADEQTLVVTVLVPRSDSLFKAKGGLLPRSPQYFREDFYVSSAVGDSLWKPRQPLPGDINTQNNEGAQTLSADGNWMFFTACGRPDSHGSCDIYFSRRTQQGWSTPVNIGAPVNSPFWESQPCFAADGRTLLFVSNRTNGCGGKDIWQATLQGFKDDGTPYFGNLTNLGEEVNTPKDENSPFLHHDGQTLYFSSDGHVGMGGMDLFVTRKMKGGKWGMPLNMGFPVNSGKDEIGLVVNARGDRAFFSSDGQDRETTGKDIYSFALPDPLQPTPALYVKGKVFDAETGKNLPAGFKLTNVKTGQLVVTAQGQEATGEFLVCLPLDGNFAFQAGYPGYLFYSGNFNLSDTHPLDRPYQLDIGLQPIKSGARTRLENIFFHTDSYQLADESDVELGELVTFLTENPGVKILLEGHTDNVGSESYNLELSANRAKAVYKELIARGVDAGRLDYKGFGFSRPAGSNNTPEGRSRNRRTEVLIH